MKNIILLYYIFYFKLYLNKVIKHHGVHFLEKKQKTYINKSNKNDIIKLLGPPSTKVLLIRFMDLY